MSEGIGKALASAIKEDKPPTAGRAAGNLFANQHRRDIFSLLTMAPCLGVAELAARLSITQNSVEWHLKALTGAGYLVRFKNGRRAAYFPEGLMSREETGLFCTINRPGHSALLRLVMKQPGLSQSEISSAIGGGRQRTARILTELERAGTVSTVSEGAHVRYYPTRLLPERAESSYRHSKDFSDYIVRRLEGESGQPPVIVKGGLERIVVELGHTSARFTIEIGINPYVTCTAC